MRSLKSFTLFVLFLVMSLATQGCGESSGGGNSGGGQQNGSGDSGELSEIDFPDQPFSLLGVYAIDNYSIVPTGTQPLENTAAQAGSQLRVNFSMSSMKILMGFEIKDLSAIYLKRGVSLTTIDLAEISKIFTDLGAEVKGPLSLKFTLSSENYPELVKKDTLKEGESLVINLTKTKDLVLDKGLGDDFTVQPEPEVVIKTQKMELDKTNHTLTHGETPYFQLNATVHPENADNKNVLFTSDNERVATIDRKTGMVTIKGPGTANITATAEDGGASPVTCVLTVKPATAVNMAFLKKENGVPLGGKVTPNLIVVPSEASVISNIKYSSDNPSVASVDANTGEVTGNTLGSANITAAYIDGTKSVYKVSVYTPVDFSNPKSLEGTYDMTSFTQTNSIKVNVKPGEGLERMIGEVVVTVDETNKTVTMKSKIQMNASALMSGLGAMAKNEQFQITQYNAQSYTDGMTDESSFGATGSQNTGIVTKETSPIDSIKIDQYFKKQVLLSVDVWVNVFAQKKSDEIKELDDSYQYWCNGANITPKACPAEEPNPSLGVF